MKTIIVGITGSISAYKAADLVRLLTKQNYNVHVLMSDAAQKFITPLTLQTLSKNPVHTDIMCENDPNKIMHIDLIKKADCFIVAPATANIIGKLAHGIGDDMISTTALASYDIPCFIAPAMNTHMYENPVVVENLGVLKKRGWIEIEPKSALLACGDRGKGALADVEDIVSTLNAWMNKETEQ